MNKCEYDPSGKHCTHKHYCIFNKNRTNLENKIMKLGTKLEEYHHIKHCFINGEIIYHDDLKDYYTIEITGYVGADEEKHYKTGVKVNDNFINVLNRKIDNLNYDLKNLVKYREDIIHGKINGFGYGD